MCHVPLCHDSDQPPEHLLENSIETMTVLQVVGFQKKKKKR
jgi:hypothetical protein